MKVCMAKEFSWFDDEMMFDSAAIEAYYADLPVGDHFDEDHSVGMCMERSELITSTNYVEVTELIVRGEFSHEELLGKDAPLLFQSLGA